MRAMLNGKQKAIISMCRSADCCINQALSKKEPFLFCIMYVSPGSSFRPGETKNISGFTEFLVLKKAGRHTYINHIVKPGLVIKKSGVGYGKTN